MPRPFVAYLRVYEPLSELDATLAKRVGKALETGPVPRAEVGDRERELWLRSQLGKKLLPGESFDVMTISPAEVPTSEAARVGPGPLVCPLDLRARSAAALVGFLASAPPILQDAALNVAPETVRARANAVMAELSAGAVHVISTTWTVPLPWFSIVDPAQRRVVLASAQDDPERQVSWRGALGDAPPPRARARKGG